MDFQCITSVEISIPQIKSIIEFFFIKNIIKVIHFFTIKQGGFPYQFVFLNHFYQNICYILLIERIIIRTDNTIMK